MREFKFRAWNSEMEYMVTTTPGVMTVLNYFIGIKPYEDIGNERLPKHYKLMQYTGLKDRNGIDIFEGDILEINGDCEDRVEVIWDECGFKFLQDNVISDQLEDIADISDVVGNIYEMKGNNND